MTSMAAKLAQAETVTRPTFTLTVVSRLYGGGMHVSSSVTLEMSGRGGGSDTGDTCSGFTAIRKNAVKGRIRKMDWR